MLNLDTSAAYLNYYYCGVLSYLQRLPASTSGLSFHEVISAIEMQQSDLADGVSDYSLLIMLLAVVEVM